MSPDDQPDLDPVLADAVRGAYVRAVDEATAKRHVSAIVAAAGAGPVPVARRPRQRRRVWRPVLAGAAATLLLPVGLAVAGVSLPDAVEQPYRTVGITLPHQTRDAQPASAPEARPVAPRAPSTTPPTALPPRPAGQRAPNPRADRQDRQRGKRQAKSRRPSVQPRPSRSGGAKKNALSPRRPAGPRHKPAGPKPPTRPKQGKSNKPTSPRAPRTNKAQPGQRRDAKKPAAGATATS